MLRYQNLRHYTNTSAEITYCEHNGKQNCLLPIFIPSIAIMKVLHLLYIILLLLNCSYIKIKLLFFQGSYKLGEKL